MSLRTRLLILVIAAMLVPAILSSLKSLLETGQAPAIKMAPPERMLAALKEMGIGTP